MIAPRGRFRKSLVEVKFSFSYENGALSAPKNAS